MRLSLLTALNAERAARRAAVLVTDLESGVQRLVRTLDVAADSLADSRTSRAASLQTSFNDRYSRNDPPAGNAHKSRVDA